MIRGLAVSLSNAKMTRYARAEPLRALHVRNEDNDLVGILVIGRSGFGGCVVILEDEVVESQEFNKKLL